MKNTAKLFAAAVVGLSFASAKAGDFFTTETKQVLGAAVGGAAVSYVAEEQLSNYVQNYQALTKAGKAGYLVVGGCLVGAAAYGLDKAIGGFVRTDAGESSLTRLAAVSLLAAVTTYVYQQKSRSEPEQQAAYVFAGQAAAAAEKAAADSSKAKATAAKAPVKK